MAVLAASTLLISACSSAEQPKPDITVRTVYVSPDLPPAAAAPDPQLSNPPRDIALLSQQETTDFWNEDRSGLKACIVQKHAALRAITGAAK